MSFRGRYHLKAQMLPEEYQQPPKPQPGSREHNPRNRFLCCNLHHQKSAQGLPKPSPAFLQTDGCGLSGRYTHCDVLQGLPVFSLSPHQMRNTHGTALPVHVRNQMASGGELQPRSAPRYRNHQSVTADFR